MAYPMQRMLTVDWPLKAVLASAAGVLSLSCGTCIYHHQSNVRQVRIRVIFIALTIPFSGKS
jgi:hypothetical protein